jgi:hypothetical protein
VASFLDVPSKNRKRKTTEIIGYTGKRVFRLVVDKMMISVALLFQPICGVTAKKDI